jgi:hypothetical protein
MTQSGRPATSRAAAARRDIMALSITNLDDAPPEAQSDSHG